ncbi:MAG TPA: hypothetical protein PKM36_08725 [Propionibacteriaceae bacterium]|nr:hypothetical protein [Propionibacteriaceae bacterium]HPZ49933.1 hypothetical protein [Propionibacteriaceae bacterium]HQE31731.1 hypothetical protein [Propionibacteriaceae bacterium]
MAFALVGEEVPVGAVEAGESFLAALAAVGWSADTLQRHADDRRSAELPWPHPVPVDWLRSYGAARWSAVLADLVSRLQLDVAPTAVRATRPLSPDERRLLADVPPHHGS